MTGQMVKLPEDEDTPEKVSRSSASPFSKTAQNGSRRSARGETNLNITTTTHFLNDAVLPQQRVDKIFRMMDRDKNAQRKYPHPQSWTIHQVKSDRS